MSRSLKHLLILVTLLLWITTPVFAANWLTMDEKSTSIYQIDTERITFSGEEADQYGQLELWMKTIEKDGSGSYMLSNYLVKKNLNFVLKERTSYSASGEIKNSFHNTNLDKWLVTTPSSPIGGIAAQIFANYQKDPESLKNMALVNAPADPQIVVNPEELKQALDDKRIKNGQNKDGTKWFYVRDTWSAYHFLEKEHMTADFWLITGTNTKYSRFNFSFSDERAGSHTMKEAVTILVDNQEWVLSPPITPGATSFPNAMFNYSYNIPNSLLQALLTTQNGITVKWRQSWGSWKDYDYTIPAKTVHDIQLMYAGCK
jgi:hypothetical protein